MRVWPIFLLLAFAALLGATTAAARPAEGARTTTTATQAIAYFNALRAAHGIPFPLTEVIEWSQGCRLHNAYVQLNGRTDGHSEDDRKPGYSAAGHLAASTSVLAGDGQFPHWHAAPFHLAQILSPQLTQTGYDASQGSACMNTIRGRRPASQGPDAIYTFPGNQTKNFPYEEAICCELPRTPAQDVGLALNTTTGPSLLVLPDGPWATQGVSIVAASLEGGGALLTLDPAAPKTGLLRATTSGTVLILPTKPLRPATPYRAQVTLRSGGGDRTHSWGFTTVARENEVSVSIGRDESERVSLLVSSDAPLAVLELVRGNERLRPALSTRRDGYGTGPLSLEPGRWRACASSGGGASTFAAAQSCESFDVRPTRTPAASYASLAIRFTPSATLLTIRARGPLVGATARVSFRAGHICFFTATECASHGKTMMRSIKLRAVQTLSLPPTPLTRSGLSDAYLRVFQFTTSSGKRYAAFEKRLRKSPR